MLILFGIVLTAIVVGLLVGLMDESS